MRTQPQATNHLLPALSLSHGTLSEEENVSLTFDLDDRLPAEGLTGGKELLMLKRTHTYKYQAFNYIL